MSDYPSIGNISRLSCSFFDENNQPADPTTVIVEVKPPRAVAESFTSVVRDGVGLYHYDLELTDSGNWYYHFIGTGQIEAQSADQLIRVRSSF